MCEPDAAPKRPPVSVTYVEVGDGYVVASTDILEISSAAEEAPAE